MASSRATRVTKKVPPNKNRQQEQGRNEHNAFRIQPFLYSRDGNAVVVWGMQTLQVLGTFITFSVWMGFTVSSGKGVWPPERNAIGRKHSSASSVAVA